MNDSPKVALISGAGGGLGRRLVEGFAATGWRVAAAGHRAIPEHDHEQVWNTVMDVTNAADCERVVSRIEERWGRLDLLVHNAGIVRDRLVPSMTNEDWDSVLDVVLKGAFLGSRAALPGMIARAAGQIVFVGSYSGRSGATGQANYAAAKAGLVGLACSLAREVAPSGVRVNVVLPGLLPTKMLAGLSPESRAALVGATLLGRPNRFEEVVALTIDLAKTRDVSGQIFQWDSRIGRWA